MDESITLQDCTNETTTDVSGKEMLIFNVGGVKFETYRSTLSRMTSGPFADNTFLLEHFRQESNDYFFDRDPEVFKVVINYLRTGSVTIPPGIDETSLKNELVFWGLASAMEQSGNAHFAQSQAITGRSEHVGIHRREAVNEHKIWKVLSEPSTSLWASPYAGLSYLFMCLSVFILVAQTTPVLQKPLFGEANSENRNDTRETDIRFQGTYLAADIVVLGCGLFFTLEYIIRVVYAPNRLRFILSFLGVIDILAVLPECVIFLLTFIVNVSASLTVLNILNVFRILRMLRVFKHFKKLTGTEFIVSTLKSSVGELVLLFGVTVISVLFWGTLIYYLEHGKDDMYGMGFDNIPQVYWLAIVTMTTVGYGDLIPITTAGKVASSLCAVSGWLVIALFVTVLVNKMMVCSNAMQKTGHHQITATGRRTNKCHP